MPEELLVILGAEAALLVFVTAMTLHIRRMDVLSGQPLERPAASPAGERFSLRSVRARTWDLLRLTRWVGVARIKPPMGSLRSAARRASRTKKGFF
jgi:hypothetical protein